MKKLIATTLVLCMALAAFASLSVTAAYTEVPSSITHTSQMMDSESNKITDAYFGTPTYNENNLTIGSSIWDNIPSYRHAQNTVYTSTNETIAYVTFIKFMWDNENLYVQQTVQNGGKYADNIGDELGTNWTNEYTWNPNGKDSDISSYNIMIPKDVATDVMTSLVVAVSPNLSDEVVPSFVRVREIYVNSTIYSEKGHKSDYIENDAVISYSQKTSDGYVMETVIPWSEIGTTAPTSGQEIGVKFNPTGFGYHINHDVSGVDGDRYGHECVTLYDYVPDTANWEITNNTFAAAKTNDDGAYLIEDAADLLGLSYVMANSVGTDDTKASALTLGKTFLVTADIDLNPNENWESFDPATAEVAQEWKTIEKFYGTFDGQGHWIKGVYHASANNTEFGFIGHLKSGAVKNIRFDNGYMTTTSSKDGGFVVGCGHTGASTVENIYVGENVTVHGIVGSDGNKYAAGIVGTIWSDGTVTVKNVVFAGKVTHAVTTATNRMIGLIGKVNNKTAGSSAVVLSDAIVLSEAGYAKSDNWGGITTQNRVEIKPAAGTNDGAWVNTELGVLPVAVADMFTDIYWQTTAEENGKFDVRLVGELASLNYTSVDFKVTVVNETDDKTAEWGFGATDKNGNAYVLSKTAYSSVLANTVEKTAENLNAGVLDGDDNKLYALTLNNLDATKTYKIYATTVWTLADGTTTVESTVEHLVTPVPYVAE